MSHGAHCMRSFVMVEHCLDSLIRSDTCAPAHYITDINGGRAFWSDSTVQECTASELMTQYVLVKNKFQILRLN